MNSNLARPITALPESIGVPVLIVEKALIVEKSTVLGIANSDQLPAPSPTFVFPRREMVILASILVLLQLADGLLTGVGVYHMGIEMEANPLLRMLMGVFGLIPTLIAVKTLAIIVIAVLASLSAVVPWITLAFRGMVALYTLIAVLPWSAILYGYFAA